MVDLKPSNEEIADILDRIADLLEAQNANPFRIRAYRNGAATVHAADESVADIALKEGRDGLQALPGIGAALAGVIEEFVRMGRSNTLARLQGEVSPEEVFIQVPAIDEELAHRIATQLDIDTLEELEQAAYDGRLQQVEGVDYQLAESIRLSLAGLLSGAARRRVLRKRGTEAEEEEPSVATLLDVDTEYRHKAEQGELARIAPKRFNPEGEVWLPILHTQRGKWNFTVVYSNTARAHELDKTHDWVVIYYDEDGYERQVTVITRGSGPLEGRRVVRGREEESRRYYEEKEGERV